MKINNEALEKLLDYSIIVMFSGVVLIFPARCIWDPKLSTKIGPGSAYDIPLDWSGRTVRDEYGKPYPPIEDWKSLPLTD